MLSRSDKRQLARIIDVMPEPARSRGFEMLLGSPEKQEEIGRIFWETMSDLLAEKGVMANEIQHAAQREVVTRKRK